MSYATSDLWGEFQENYRYAHDYWAPFVANAGVYTLAASGYSWSEQERVELAKEGREPIELNIMRRPIQFFNGYLSDNLNSIVYEPIEGSDQKTADQLTKMSYYVWDKGAGYKTFLDAASESFKSGISFVGLEMDYSRDFINGDLRFFKRVYNQMYLDPTFENIDLSDCAFSISRDLLSRDMAKQLLPYVSPEEIDSIQASYRDDKFLTYHPNFTSFNRRRNLMAFDQYYKRKVRNRKMVVDEGNSFYRDITDLDKDAEYTLRKGIRRLDKVCEEMAAAGVDERQLPARISIQEVERPYVELIVMLNSVEVYRGPDRTGIEDTYPFVPLMCYFEPSIWFPSQRIQSMAATTYYAQRQFNKRHMKIIDMMDSTISTGFKYLLGSVPDPSDMQQSGQNKLIGVDPEAPGGLAAVQELQGGRASPELIQYQQVLDQLTLTLSNVNESVLGIDEKGNTQVSGRLAQVRAAQGLRSNRQVFDNLEHSQKLLGGLVLRTIQNKYPPGKVKRIIGEEPTEQFYNGQFEQYDAVIKEGVRSQSQKDAYYYELVTLKRDGIVNVPEEEIIDSLQMVGIDKLKEAIAKQQAEVQKAAKDAHDQEVKLQAAQEEQYRALAAERMARVESNVGLKEERISEAAQNRSQAALDRAKTIVEISKLNNERIMQVLDFVGQLQTAEKVDQEQIDQKLQQESAAINEKAQQDLEPREETNGIQG